MNINNTYSFWGLINKYKINIPIIQRDYAQGRTSEIEKRERFLTNIKKHIVENKKMHLDFVYGKIENDIFYPIDGQQRLTTLFLLHWYFSLKENGKCADVLLKFEYDTRISSREFCKAIVSNEIVLPTLTSTECFINYLKNKKWFLRSWLLDPTIKSMLNMIQSIHELFYEIEIENVFEILTEDQLITFECLNLGEKEFDLTDELYIKMNARGKQLTNFENFKANFIQLIDNNFEKEVLHHPIKGEISYSGYFSYRIEKEWTELFWDYRGEKVTIDKEFFKYFEFITQMCFFKDTANLLTDSFTNSLDNYEEVYKKEANLLFLFNSLDKLYSINSEKDSSLKNFFSQLINTSADFEKVTLLWNTHSDIDLFKCLIKSDDLSKEDVRNKIILYCILEYLISQNTSSVTTGLSAYVRIIRNLLQARRQKNNTSYNTNVRINEFVNYWKLFKQLITDNPFETLATFDVNENNKGTDLSNQSLRNEIEKAIIRNGGISVSQLEEFKYLGGLLHIFNFNDCSSEEVNNITDSISEIWSDDIPDSLNIGALITCGFGGIYIKDTNMGESWYFGKKGNWDFILTSDDETVANSIRTLVTKYLAKEGSSVNRLTGIIQDWINENPNNKSWQYYFIKYDQFLSGLNYFIWFNNDFEIRLSGTVGLSPLSAYHINPFVLTVGMLIADDSICDLRDCYKQYTGVSSLKLKNQIEMYSESEGWKIKLNGQQIEGLIQKYKIENDKDDYLLKETLEKDRVQIAVDFINDLYN